MRSISHSAIGVGGAIGASFLGLPAAAVGFYLGANAPDYLEISYKKANEAGDKVWHYRRLIPHRTLTHWAPLWLALLFIIQHYLFAQQLLPQSVSYIATYLQQALVAYCISAIVHIFCDSLTPMGVPIWHPFGKRYSYRMVRGVVTEFLGMFSILVISGLGVLLYKGILSI